MSLGWQTVTGCVFCCVLFGSTEKIFTTAEKDVNVVVIYDLLPVPLSPENRAPSPAWL